MSKIVIFTDLHYWENIKDKARPGINTHGNTDELILKLKEGVKEVSPDVLINLWDLVFWNTLEEKLERYKYMNKLLFSQLSFPSYHLLGNHEFFLTVTKDIESTLDTSMRNSFAVNNTKHILLDIEFSLEKLFQVSEETIKWLQEELKTELPVVIYCHYPITQKEENISYYHKKIPERSFLANSEELKDIIKWTTCKYWISWHTHFHFETEIDGVNHITLPSFAEDNTGKPNGSYAVFDTYTLSLDIKHII